MYLRLHTSTCTNLNAHNYVYIHVFARCLQKEKEVGVMLSKGGRKHGGGGAFNGRVERPYSIVPVLPTYICICIYTCICM